ncbi:hypothetical protein NPIL_26061, partial [Nephila pilipes]
CAVVMACLESHKTHIGEELIMLKRNKLALRRSCPVKILNIATAEVRCDPGHSGIHRAHFKTYHHKREKSHDDMIA